jgi:hypothetical protein
MDFIGTMYEKGIMVLIVFITEMKSSAEEVCRLEPLMGPSKLNYLQSKNQQENQCGANFL